MSLMCAFRLSKEGMPHTFEQKSELRLMTVLETFSVPFLILLRYLIVLQPFKHKLVV